jgi:hypothetical protein
MGWVEDEVGSGAGREAGGCSDISSDKSSQAF